MERGLGDELGADGDFETYVDYTDAQLSVKIHRLQERIGLLEGLVGDARGEQEELIGQLIMRHVDSL